MSSLGWKPVAALAISLIIWASFLVVTRAAMTAEIGVIEVGLIRYGVGSLFFLPIAIRHGLATRSIRARDVALIPLFGGVLFMLFLGSGLQIAPVADSGVFTPSMLPLYVAILSFFFLGERFTRPRVIGFVMIVVGAVAVGGWTAMAEGEVGVWRGHLLFSAASLSWAVYTVVFKTSGLSPAIGGAVLCICSALIFAGLGLVYGLDFSGIPPGALAIQILFQGILSGFVATFTYFYAVQTLGASRTAAFAALVPVMAALGGLVFLGEPIGWLKAIGILVVAAGVALASGALTGRKRVIQNISDDA